MCNSLNLVATAVYLYIELSIVRSIKDPKKNLESIASSNIFAKHIYEYHPQDNMLLTYYCMPKYSIY